MSILDFRSRVGEGDRCSSSRPCRPVLPTQHEDVLSNPGKRIIVCLTNHTNALVSPIRTTTSVHVFLRFTDNTVLISVVCLTNYTDLPFEEVWFAPLAVFCESLQLSRGAARLMTGNPST